MKDVTPMPDQDNIRNNVLRVQYRTKIDISDAYEQIHVEPEDVWKNTFSMVYGTFTGNIMLIGDCNAPSTFQRFMTELFQDFIEKFLEVYLDDIFIYISKRPNSFFLTLHTLIKLQNIFL